MSFFMKKKTEPKRSDPLFFTAYDCKTTVQDMESSSDVF